MTQPGWLDALDEPQAPQPDWLNAAVPQAARPQQTPDWLQPPYSEPQPTIYGYGPVRRGSLIERVGKTIAKIGADVVESVNIAPELFGGKPISLRERAGRAFNLASFFIPVGRIAKGASLLKRVALRGGAFGAIGATSAAIRGHPVATAALGSAAFGGAFEAVGGTLARVFRRRAGQRVLDALDADPTSFANPGRTPLHNAPWSIVNVMKTGDDLRLPDDVNERLHFELGKALGNEGWTIREVFGFGNGQARGEKAWFVPGMGEREALEWATMSKFPQRWVLTSDGLVDLQARTRQAIRKSGTRFDANVDPTHDSYTEMLVGGQKRSFSLSFDSPIDVNPRAQPSEAGEKLAGLISRDEEGLFGKIKSLTNELQWRSLYVKAVRSFAGLEFAEPILGKPTVARLVSESPAKLAQMASSWASFAEHAMRFGLVSFKDRTKVIKPALLDIFGKIRGNEREAFESYGLAKWLTQFNDELGTPLPANLKLDDLRAAIVGAEQQFPHFRQVFDEIRDWRHTALSNWLVESGQVSEREFAELMKETPTRLLQASKEDASKFEPWMETLVRDMYQWSRSVHQQEVKGTFARLLSEVDPTLAGRYVAALPAGKLAPYAEPPNVVSVLAQGFERDVMALAKPGAERVRFQITDPDIVEAFKAMNPPQLNVFFRLASTVASMLRAGATLSFEFMARNPFRDTLFAKTTSGAPIHDFLKGFASAFKQDELYQRFVASGGSRATLISMDLPAIRKGIEEAIGKEATLGQKVSNVIKYPYHGLQAMSDFLETGTRLGAFNRQYRTLLVAGMAPAEAVREAALHARNVTVDFSVHGSRTGALRMMTAFWNAQIQGYDRLVRAFRSDPNGVAMRLLAYITVPSVVLYMINRDDPEYAQLPLWERNMFWHVKAPEWLPVVGDRWLRFPKPFDLGILFGSSVERFMEYADTQDPKALDAMATNYVQKVFQDVVPLPTILRPLFENTINYSFLRGRPVESRSLEDVAPEFRQQPGTSEVAKGFGKLLGISPVKIDNLLFGYTGGLGRLGADAVDLGIEVVRGEFALPRGAPVFDPRDIPGLRGLVAQFPRNSETVDKLYEFADRTREAAATAQFLERTLQVDDLVDWMQQRAFLLGANEVLGDVIGEMRQLRQYRDIVLQDEAMSPRERASTLNSLDQAMLSLAMSMQSVIMAADHQEEQR